MPDFKLEAYSSLAWTEEFLAPPQEYSREAHLLCQAVFDHISYRPETMLHLGCGAGGHDTVFKTYFRVTGVDLSPEMLRLARKKHPELTYIKGDMRTVFLSQRYDIVAIPDSIGYMTTVSDLQKAVENAAAHLEDDGLILVMALTAEDFRENNFVYTGENEGLRVTLFENNARPYPDSATYEAALVYLIRRGEELEVYPECHKLGLFSEDTWYEVFDRAGLNVSSIPMDDLYDIYLMEEGSYRQQLFLCSRR